MKQSEFPDVLKDYQQAGQGGCNQRRTSPTALINGKDGEKKPSTENDATDGQPDTENSSCGGRSKNKGSRQMYRCSQAQHVQTKPNTVIYESWQVAKHELREADYVQLKQKLSLQRELIQAQDDYAQQRKALDQERKQQFQCVTRKERLATVAALENICRQSLKQDRRLQQSSRKSLSGSNAREPRCPEAPAAVVPRSSIVRSAQLSPTGGHDRRISFSPVWERPETSEDCVQDDDEMVLSIEQIERLPWHHVQLYQLYGRQADDYLHPKIEQAQDKGVCPKIRHHMKDNNDRPDAATLWLSLREDSNLKLLKEDSMISRDLKETFAAFSRHCLTQQNLAITRNYFAEEDVPDMEVFLDRRVVKRARNAKHKAEMMYRSSRSNEDRAGILEHNNPVPDLNNRHGQQSIDRYMPSWVGGSDTESELSYKKWLPPTISQESNFVEVPVAGGRGGSGGGPSSTTMATDHGNVDVHNEWAFLEKRQEQQKENQPKLHFLTEKDATVAGQFSKRRKDVAEMRGIPETSNRTVDAKKTNLGAKNQDSRRVSNMSSRSAPPSLEDNAWRRSPWQPLSLHALLEYTTRKETLGVGEYCHGRTRMWSAATTYN